jgi:hypothetical protein
MNLPIRDSATGNHDADFHLMKTPPFEQGRAIAGLLLAAFLLAGCTTAARMSPSEGNPMSIEQTRRALQGEWVSIAPEVRPSATKNPDGTLKAFHLTRDFKYLGDDRFELTIVNSADPYGKVPLARIYLRGHMQWQGDHPIAPGAQKVNFVADEDYQVTPLAQPFAEVLNRVAGSGYARWEVDTPQRIFGKAFAPFGLAEGRNFMEYDLVYLHGDMLFWGARNVDGRGFDTEANRPTNLQIPLRRK